jgi:hypothetical protein
MGLGITMTRGPKSLWYICKMHCINDTHTHTHTHPSSSSGIFQSSCYLVRSESEVPCTYWTPCRASWMHWHHCCAWQRGCSPWWSSRRLPTLAIRGTYSTQEKPPATPGGTLRSIMDFTLMERCRIIALTDYQIREWSKWMKQYSVGN